MPEYDINQSRSEELEEVLGKAPSSVVRKGNIVIFSIVILILLGCYLFRYPDIVRAKIEVFSENPPADVKARTSGKLQNLFVDNLEKVKKDQVLAVIQNTANLDNVKSLKKDVVGLISGLDNDTMVNNVSNFSHEGFVLGDIQNYYTSLQRSISNYNDFISRDDYGKRIKAQEKQLEVQKNFSVEDSKQIEEYSRQKDLSEAKYERYKDLFQRKVVPQAELENVEKEYLNSVLSYKNKNASLYNTELQLVQLTNNILDLNIQKNESLRSLIKDIKERASILHAQILKWEQNYLLISPVDGQVTFTSIWDKNHNVNSGQIVMSVVPDNNQNIIGKVKLPIQGSGKVREKQDVVIHFDNYPYMEFGSVRGEIKNISLVPEQGFYILEVRFNNGLKTNLSYNLKLSQQMSGEAQIVTENRSLLEKFLKPIEAVLTDKNGLKETN